MSTACVCQMADAGEQMLEGPRKPDEIKKILAGEWVHGARVPSTSEPHP